MSLAEINFDRWLAIAGTILAVIGIYLSYYFYRKGVQAKSLCIDAVGSISLIKRLKSATDNLKIVYDGTEVNGIYRSYVLFWNFGHQFIDGDDFFGQIKIVDPDKTIALVKIVDRDVAANVSVKLSDDKEWILVIDLLREGEAFVIAVDSLDHKYKVEIEANSKSRKLVKGFPEGKHLILQALTFVFVISGFVLGVALLLTTVKLLTPYFDNQSLAIRNAVALILGIVCVVVLPIIFGVFAFKILSNALGFSKSSTVTKHIGLKQPRVFDSDLYETEIGL